MNEKRPSQVTDDKQREQRKKDSHIPILPYTYVVGQKKLKLALELAYIAPRIGGVLISGQRGTAKSTIVRAFASMVYNGSLPITIPINATEDRVVGGWQIDKLIVGQFEEQPGLLKQADKKLLYIDEINLLDDHIVNIILDVTSTGILVNQREAHDDQESINFTLVGTMNPEEGSLRPQLLDRFGLMVQVRAEEDLEVRQKILQRVLDYDQAVDEYRQQKELELSQPPQVKFFKDAMPSLRRLKQQLTDARALLYSIEVPRQIVRTCSRIVQEFNAEGHRGDYVMALAARAHAAHGFARGQRKSKVVMASDIQEVAGLVLQHRLQGAELQTNTVWGEKEEERLKEVIMSNYEAKENNK